jgi:hypothetical protein
MDAADLLLAGAPNGGTHQSPPILFAAGQTIAPADLVKRTQVPVNRQFLLPSDIPLFCWLAIAALSALLLPRSLAFSVAGLAACAVRSVSPDKALAAKMQRALGVTAEQSRALLARQGRYRFENSIAFFRD